MWRFIEAAARSEDEAERLPTCQGIHLLLEKTRQNLIKSAVESDMADHSKLIFLVRDIRIYYPIVS